MESADISPDDAQLLARITTRVLSEPRQFERGAELLRDRFSLASLRRQSVVELCAFRAAVYPREQELHMETWGKSHERPLLRDGQGLILMYQPGTVTRRRWRTGLKWRRHSGKLPTAVATRLHTAIAWARALTPGTLTVSHAEAIYLLSWVMYDERAHEREEVLTDFQLLPWAWFSEVGGKHCQGRELAAKLHLDREWASLAGIAEAKLGTDRRWELQANLDVIPTVIDQAARPRAGMGQSRSPMVDPEPRHEPPSSLEADIVRLPKAEAASRPAPARAKQRKTEPSPSQTPAPAETPGAGVQRSTTATPPPMQQPADPPPQGTVLAIPRAPEPEHGPAPTTAPTPQLEPTPPPGPTPAPLAASGAAPATSSSPSIQPHAAPPTERAFAPTPESIPATQPASHPAAPARPRSTHSAKRVATAPDFSWMRVGENVYRFDTTNQRGLVRVLFEAWERSGRIDGCGLTEAAIQEGMGVAVERLRVPRVLGATGALDTIVRRVAPAVWALYLNSVPPNEGPLKAHK